jgi:SAM-dependent methyltransferase
MTRGYMTLADWRELYRLGRARLHSAHDYQRFQVFQGTLLIRFLASRGVPVAGRRVADIGCGIGGFSLALAASGSHVTALDLFSEGWPVALAAQVPAVAADALRLPLRSDAFDLVVCASLIEHVAQPDRLLGELARVVCPRGAVYLSFPPFYSPRGGHQLSPFHYLGERRAISLARRLNRGHQSEWIEDMFPEEGDSLDSLWGEWGLQVLTIGKFERLLADSPLRLVERSTRLLPVDFSGLPLLREVLTWHVQYLLARPAQD